MMKKTLVIILTLCMLLGAVPSLAATSVKVTIPSFDVTLNGEKLDSKNSEYPLIVYKDITYVPMTYHYARFLGLKTLWYDMTESGSRTIHGNTFYVGNSGEYASELEQYPAAVPNSASSYEATIADYHIAVNHARREAYIDNENEEYPVLNFRGVTYFPLTWRFAHDEFGWKYSFGENGLIIDSRDAFRPVTPDIEVERCALENRMAHVRTDYVYNDDCYAGYPPTTFGGQYEFVWCVKGHDEKRFSLEKELNENKVTYLNSETPGGGIVNESGVQPQLEGSILTIHCVGSGESSNSENLVLKIDMEKGELISID